MRYLFLAAVFACAGLAAGRSSRSSGLTLPARAWQRDGQAGRAGLLWQRRPAERFWCNALSSQAGCVRAVFKQRIREITRKAKGVSMKTTIEELAPYMRGWRGYFGFCETPEVLIGLTRRVRLRLRAALWRQWKTPRRRRAALLELGVRERLASNTASSGRGPWYLAKAKALSVGLSNKYFRSLGLPSLFEEC